MFMHIRGTMGICRDGYWEKIGENTCGGTETGWGCVWGIGENTCGHTNTCIESKMLIIIITFQWYKNGDGERIFRQ